MHGDEERDLTALFGGFPESLAICRRIEQVVATIGEVSVNVTKSQVAFRRRRGFAWVWRPGQYVNNPVPAVLSIALPREVKSDRFKSVVHPSAKVWMHHIEIRDVSQIDDEIRGWLGEAYAHAG
ncbi:DUF5655 domain-containing protein [Aeromicrobium sp.]|uniref:DUF5655 domain-containing protein n=1 Tax=Aeromicrobium sp. TaxID=1871063 RepID=UPI002FC6B4B6